jgi:hypothetical protein
VSVFQAKAPSSRQGVTQTLAVTSTSGAITNAFGAQTYQVRLVATAACNIAIGNSPTASTTSTLLPANTQMTFTVTPGQSIAAVGSGTLFVTELS